MEENLIKKNNGRNAEKQRNIENTEENTTKTMKRGEQETMFQRLYAPQSKKQEDKKEEKPLKPSLTLHKN